MALFKTVIPSDCQCVGSTVQVAQDGSEHFGERATGRGVESNGDDADEGELGNVIISWGALAERLGWELTGSNESFRQVSQSARSISWIISSAVISHTTGVS